MSIWLQIFIKRFWYCFISGGILALIGTFLENKVMIIISMILILIALVLNYMMMSEFIQDHLEFETAFKVKAVSRTGEKKAMRFSNTCKAFDLKHVYEKLKDVYYVYFVSTHDRIKKGPKVRQKVYLNVANHKILLFYRRNFSLSTPMNSF